jgi:hypothetical protein
MGAVRSELSLQLLSRKENIRRLQTSDHQQEDGRARGKGRLGLPVSPDKPEEIDDYGNPLLLLRFSYGYSGCQEVCSFGWAKKRVNENIGQFDEHEELSVGDFGGDSEDED